MFCCKVLERAGQSRNVVGMFVSIQVWWMMRGIVPRAAAARLAALLPSPPVCLPPLLLLLSLLLPLPPLLLLVCTTTSAVAMLPAPLYETTAFWSPSDDLLLPTSCMPLLAPPIAVRKRAFSCCPCRLSGLHCEMDCWNHCG